MTECRPNVLCFLGWVVSINPGRAELTATMSGVVQAGNGYVGGLAIYG